jgi:hypothetical protein
VSVNKQVLDEDIDVRDRTLRFAWLQKRYAREWATPTVAMDDHTGKEEEADIVDLLVSRLSALKASM